MADRTPREVAHVAAVWWANRICHPKFDNGDPSFTGAMATTMAMLGTKEVTREQKLKFIDVMTGTLTVQLEKENAVVELDVDYGPCFALFSLANLADIPAGNFPWKTHMRIQPQHIEASYGYQAGMEYPLDHPEEE
jgi:hypothetical protein